MQEGRWKWSVEYHGKYRAQAGGGGSHSSFRNRYIMISMIRSHKHMGTTPPAEMYKLCERLLPFRVFFFLDWPRNPFICPRFIIGQAKWLAPFLSFITAALQISRQTAGEFPAKGQMVEEPLQRKLCLPTAIVVVWSPAAQFVQQQRAVVKFHISKKPEVCNPERGSVPVLPLCVTKYTPVLGFCSNYQYIFRTC